MPHPHGLALLTTTMTTPASERSDHRKQQTLDYRNGYAVSQNVLRRDLQFTLDDDEVLKALSQSSKLQFGLGKRIKGPLQERGDHFLSDLKKSQDEHVKTFLPAHVAFDKTVLRFDAYFKQTVHDSVEQFYVRKVRILYYVEDDTIAVVEPPVENSGIPQGVLIKRQKLPRDSESYFSIKDLDVGKNVTFYGKTFRIVGCDKFTQNYLQLNEKRVVGPPEPMPVDQYIASRSRAHRIARSTPPNDKLRRFLDHDRQVLRFFCVWDDRGSMFGELRDFVLHYYLVDDSVEVREVQKPNQGRDPFPVLLRRQRLPRVLKDLSSLADDQMVHWTDLGVGRTLDVLGRKFMLRDCDEYTKQFFKQHLHLTDDAFAPVQVPQQQGEREHVKEQPPKQQPYPPYNGFGSEEDSLGSCKYLVLKPPKKDFVKLLENEHKILRFLAILDEPGAGSDPQRMVQAKHEQQDEAAHADGAGPASAKAAPSKIVNTPQAPVRMFVLSYYLADDTVSLYEPPARNSGFTGGKFLERCRCLKPGYTPQVAAYYAAEDLYIGAMVIVNNHKFWLVDADEYVLRFMEDRKQQFWRSDWNRVLQHIRETQGDKEGLFVELGARFRQLDEGATGWVDSDQARALLDDLCYGLVSRHEIVTLVRAFEAEQNGRKFNYAQVFPAE